jgi:ATP-dependent protease Clp ATPase subunit
MILKTEINFREIVNEVTKDYDNNFSSNIKYHESVEKAILMWIKFLIEKVDDLYSLRAIIEEATIELNYELRNTKDVMDICRLSYTVDILKTCLFIIDVDLEKQKAPEAYVF